MFSPKSHAQVGKEFLLQYSEAWPLSADIRRHLTLEYSIPKRDMWSELAEEVVKSGAKRVVELGCSSGYIIKKMLEHGFEGEIVGIDKEDIYLPFVEEIIRKEFPTTKASVRLIQGDAQYLNLEDIGGEPFDAGIAANLLYHVPHKQKVFKCLNEIVKDQGLQFFTTKDIEHQSEVWTFANNLATRVGANAIHSFYWHFQTSQLDQTLRESKRFQTIPDLRGEHISETWIPDTDYGWNDFMQTVLTLVPIMEVKGNGLPPSIDNCIDVLESETFKHHLFKQVAAQNGGYFKGSVSMSWRAAINNNPKVK